MNVTPPHPLQIVHDAALVHYFTVDIVPLFRAALSRVATSCVKLSEAVEPGAAAARRRRQQQQQQQQQHAGLKHAAGEAGGDVEQGRVAEEEEEEEAKRPPPDKPWPAVKRELRHVMRQAVHGYWARVRRDGETRVRIIEAHRVSAVAVAVVGFGAASAPAAVRPLAGPLGGRVRGCPKNLAGGYQAEGQRDLAEQALCVCCLHCDCAPVANGWMQLG